MDTMSCSTRQGLSPRGVQGDPVNPADGIEEKKLLEYIARAEYGSNHPVALAIIEAYGKTGRRGVKAIPKPRGWG